MSQERIARYYQRMSPELRKQWDRLSPEQRKAIFLFLEKFHEVMEVATWDFIAGIIKAFLPER